MTWGAVPAQDLELSSHCYPDDRCREGKCCVYTAGCKHPVQCDSKWEISPSETPAWHSQALSVADTTPYSWPGQDLCGRDSQRKSWNV